MDNAAVANNNNDNNNNNINNSDTETTVIVTDTDNEGPTPFPEPFQKENVTFMRLIRRLEAQREFERGRFETPCINDFIHNFPVYGKYEEASFGRAYDAVKVWFGKCK